MSQNIRKFGNILEIFYSTALVYCNPKKTPSAARRMLCKSARGCRFWNGGITKFVVLICFFLVQFIQVSDTSRKSCWHLLSDLVPISRFSWNRVRVESVQRTQTVEKAGVKISKTQPAQRIPHFVFSGLISIPHTYLKKKKISQHILGSRRSFFQGTNAMGLDSLLQCNRWRENLEKKPFIPDRKCNDQPLS